MNNAAWNISNVPLGSINNQLNVDSDDDDRPQFIDAQGKPSRGYRASTANHPVYGQFAKDGLCLSDQDPLEYKRGGDNRLVSGIFADVLMQRRALIKGQFSCRMFRECESNYFLDFLSWKHYQKGAW